ncbi:sugar ABC transporter substrate-binding protein [Oceanicola granulosus HTCC2516]|uniref:Sugar ABC transporter substrate-binding protein n=2 Tax=Oceanicola granulosus TaxID=252302 RepID=Q2CHC4_OCEGH|nr:sugar ABC transporter substrate-binding protein [Oceanicola granulosus HTCC2516]
MIYAATLATTALASAAFAQDQVTLDFWEGHSLQEEGATIKMIEAFEESHPHISINRVKTSFGTNFEAITTALASNTAPDVSPIWSGFLSQFAARGALVDLTEHGVTDPSGSIYPGAVDYVTWDGGIYGLPYAFDPRFIVYNAAALEEAGLEPAETFDEMISMAEQLAVVGDDGTVVRYGFGLGSADALAYFFINLLYAQGGDVFNEDGTQAAFNDEAGVAAGEIIARLAEQPGNTLNAQGDVVRQGVLTGRIAMVYDGPWVFHTAAQDDTSQEFVVGSVPTVAESDDPLNFGSVGAYVVYEQSEHPEEAAEFVRFLASPEAQQFRVEALKPGVSPDVLNQDVAQQTFDEWPALRTAQEELANSRIFPKHENWSAVYQAIIPAIEAIVSGDDVQGALDSAARQADRALRR